ncbi:hypothetical protein F5B22DRAFT_620196 [Xylaria bambusicola]|uniref:uncharacterized protein n=1 Tax=Xylaria bambusicola TaxID=326684 RepID=UPI002007741A|nr:uncharacterized protein F5B22DRAFT_620196 [Xylaria bambusicola]KAI0508541.1 hypothetical protein F5B22DRAFT_620196 [Xylaria bambusicola]
MRDTPNVVIGPLSTISATILDSHGPPTPQHSQPSQSEVASEDDGPWKDPLTAFYIPLPEKSIRILHLDGIKTDARAEEPLTSELVVTKLADSPTYDALSYAWACHSDPATCESPRRCCTPLKAPNAYTIQCTIRCGGSETSQNVPVSKNGYVALQALRRQLGSIKIWID